VFTQPFAVSDMPLDDSKRAYLKRSLLGCTVVAVGVAVLGLSEVQFAAGDPRVNPQVAQATPPLQSTPGAETKPSAPAEPTTSGTSTRPSDIPPQPAHPDAEAQKAGVVPALPPAPAEKVAPPIKER
jgi:hypothetical protein